MSWIERLDNIEFTITTGDGRTFTPLWKNGEKSKSYNTSNYNFINVPGGFTDRKRPQASKYPLVFWFQGDDNIEQAEAFETSADDSRSWTVKHPFYGNIVGQPLSIKFNDSKYNTTIVTVEFWESVASDYPNARRAVANVISSKADIAALSSSQSYASRLDPESEDQRILQESVEQITGSFSKLFDDINFPDYQNSIAVANNLIGNLAARPLEAVRAIQSLVQAPALFQQSVMNRIDSLRSAYDTLKETLDNDNTVNTKLYFEAIASATISGMCEASSIPLENDYISRLEIESINNIIMSTYTDYLSSLDASQIAINNIEDTYFPNPNAQFDLYDLVVDSTGNLFTLAFSAQQQRVIETTKDTNLFLLTHRFLGLDVNDQNLENFRQLNNIKNDELFRIRSGREIKYFK